MVLKTTEVISAMGMEYQTACSPTPGRKSRQGQDADQLSGDRHDQAVNAVSKGLEHGAYDDAVPSEQEAEADDPQGGHADGKHVLVRLEHHEQVPG